MYEPTDTVGTTQSHVMPRDRAWEPPALSSFRSVDRQQVEILRRSALRLAPNREEAEQLVRRTIDRAARSHRRPTGDMSIDDWLLATLYSVYMTSPACPLGDPTQAPSGARARQGARRETPVREHEEGARSHHGADVPDALAQGRDRAHGWRAGGLHVDALPRPFRQLDETGARGGDEAGSQRDDPSTGAPGGQSVSWKRPVRDPWTCRVQARLEE